MVFGYFLDNGFLKIMMFYLTRYSILDGGLNDGRIFYDMTAGPIANDAVNDFGGWSSGNGISAGGLPSCVQTTDTSNCGVAIDKTSFVPCITVDTTVVPVCQKPTMLNLYPLYAASDPTADSGTFAYPVNLMKFSR